MPEVSQHVCYIAIAKDACISVVIPMYRQGLAADFVDCSMD